jgi:hypothetical protein
MKAKNTLSDINFQIALEDLLDACSVEDYKSFLDNAMETCMTVENHLFELAENRQDFFFCYRRLLEFFEATGKCIVDSKLTM